MRKILKRIGAGILALSLVFTPNMSASAYGGGGGAGPSGITPGTPVPGLGTLNGYAFRVYLYEVNKDVDKLWKEVGNKKYKMEQNKKICNKLDSYGWSSSVYLGLKSKNSYIFNSNNGSYHKVPAKRIISDKKFNKIKGMSNYSSANVQDKKHTDWSTYFKNGSNKVFNHFTDITDSDKGTSNVIDWFEDNKFASAGKFEPSKTIIIVEPLAVWNKGGKNYLVTFQNAVYASGGARKKLMTFYGGSLDLTKNGDGLYTVKAQSRNGAKRTAYLGGVKQSWILNSDDCELDYYSAGAGYACYGTAKIESYKAGANVAIVYDGDIANVIDSRTNKEYGMDLYGNSKAYRAINLKDGTRRFIYQGKDNDFKKSTKKTSRYKKLGLTKNKDLDDYTTVLSGVWKYLQTSRDTKRYVALYGQLNVAKKLSANELRVKWSNQNIQTVLLSGKNDSQKESFLQTNSVVGKRYIPAGIKFVCRSNSDGNEFTKDVEPISKFLNSHMTIRNCGAKTKNMYYGKDRTSTDYAVHQIDAAIDTSVGAYDKTSGIQTGNTVGIGIEVLAKNREVANHIVRINVKGSESATVTHNSSKHYVLKAVNKKKGKSANYSTTPAVKGDVYAIAVPNYSAKGYSKEVANAIANACKADTKAVAKANFQNSFSSSDGVELTRDFAYKKSKKPKIYLGSTTNDKKSYGYTLYILQYKSAPPTTKAEGNLELKDYELNTVFPDMCAAASTEEKPMVVTLNKDLWTYEGLNKCDGASYNSTNEYQGYQKSYTLVITETSASGKNVEKDDSLSGTKMYLANYASPIPSNFGTRAELKKGKELDSRQDHRVTYAFNLSRGMFDDKRTVSTISDQTLGKDFATTVLDLNYGDIPGGSDAESESDTGDETGTDSDGSTDGESDTDDADGVGIKEASEKRNSNATVGDAITDTFNFDAKYKVTDSKTKHEEVVNKSHWHYYKHWYQYYTSTENGGYWSSDWYWDKNYKHNYIDFIDHADELLAFNINGENSAKAKLELKSIAHKYQTEANETGKNTKVPDSKYLSDMLQKPKTGSNGMTENLTIGSEKTGYATAYVKNSETVLSFYPEVPMQAMEYSGDTITSSDSVAIKRVLTIGEEKRNAYSSSLYLFTIKRDKTTSSDDDDLSGTTYSDTAVGGSKASKISDMVTLTAGGDFGVAIKETGFSLNLYGYSMDVINSDEDDSMLVAQSGVKDMASGLENTDDVSINYTDIVKDGSNVYADWGNSTDADSMKDEFDAWVTAMLKPENFKADMEMQLYKGGTDSTDRLRGSSVTNFNTTLGKLSDGEDGETMTFITVSR